MEIIRAKTIEFQTKQEGLQRALDVTRAKTARERERSVRDIQREENQEVTGNSKPSQSGGRRAALYPAVDHWRDRVRVAPSA